MAKCFVCESLLQKKWRYCPECGTKLEDSKLKYEGYSIERLRNMWIQQGGENLYKNFRSVEQSGRLQFPPAKPIRPVLGDFVSIHFSNIRTLSFLSLQPDCIKEVCDIFRVMWYYATDYGLRNTKLSRMVDTISKTELFWRLLKNSKIQKFFTIGWEKSHEAIIEVESVDIEKNKISFSVDEDLMFYLKTCRLSNFIDLSLLGGQLEAICNRKCIGEEELHEGKRYFVYRLYPNKEDVEYPITYYKEGEYDKAVDELVDYIVNKKSSGRVKLEDKVHISGEQCDAYFIIKASEGHRILEKYAGVKCGKKIAEKAGLDGLNESLNYLRELFSYYKLGLLRQPETRGKQIIIKLDESIYASGVNNIQMKLCLFSAGLIEGVLGKSTDERWTVDETRCLAKGDEYCEFTCKTR
jgi:predicted hydrocarbon binding protein